MSLLLLASILFDCEVLQSLSIPPPEVDTTSIYRTQTIDDVVVTGERAPLDPLSTSSVSRLNRKQLEQAEQSSLLSVLQEHVPGLFVTSRAMMGYGLSSGAAGAMTMRGVGGAPTTALLVVIDDIPQYSGLMGHPIADSYLTHQAERVEVVRGPASVRYGSQAMAGVIRITTRSADDEGVHTGLRLGGGSYGSLTSHVEAGYRCRSFSFRATGHYNRSDGHRPNMSFGQGGGAFSLGWKPSSRWQMGWNGWVDCFRFANPGEEENPILDHDARILRGSSTLTVRHEHPVSRGHVTLFYQAGRHKIDEGHRIDEPPQASLFLSVDHTLGIIWQESRQLFRGNSLSFGGSFFDFGGEIWDLDPTTGEKTPTADPREQEWGAYLDCVQQLGPLRLDAGIRYAYHSHVGGVWIPQGSLSCRLPARIELQASVGKGFRFPTIREMFLFPAQNPDLKPESLLQYEIGWRQSLFRNRFSYRLTLYFIEGENRIQTRYVEGRPRNENTGRIENRGVEAEALLQLGRWCQLEANYSLLDMRYPQLAAPRHKLDGAFRWERKHWQLSSGVQYVCGLYTRLATAEQSAVEESFVLWNLRASVALVPTLRLWARVENLLGQHYEVQAGFPMPGVTCMAGIEWRWK